MERFYLPSLIETKGSQLLRVESQCLRVNLITLDIATDNGRRKDKHHWMRDSFSLHPLLSSFLPLLLLLLLLLITSSLGILFALSQHPHIVTLTQADSFRCITTIQRVHWSKRRGVCKRSQDAFSLSPSVFNGSAKLEGKNKWIFPPAEMDRDSEREARMKKYSRGMAKEEWTSRHALTQRDPHNTTTNVFACYCRLTTNSLLFLFSSPLSLYRATTITPIHRVIDTKEEDEKDGRAS